MKITEYKIFSGIGFVAMLSLFGMSLVLFYGGLMGYIHSESNILMAILVIIIFASISIAASTYASSIRSRK